jgi:hypothetical protein
LRKAEAVRASEMTVMAHNCRRTTRSSHAGLHHNGGRPAPKRRHMWCISSKLVLMSGEPVKPPAQRQLDLWHRLNDKWLLWCGQAQQHSSQVNVTYSTYILCRQNIMSICRINRSVWSQLYVTTAQFLVNYYLTQ